MGQCRNALHQLARGDETKAELLPQQFMLFVYIPPHEMESLKSYQPGLIWGQFAGDYDVLATELQKIFKGPASTAAVERHHNKTGQRVTTNVRGRLGEGKIKRQVAIAYNSASLEKQLPLRRTHGLLARLAALCEDVEDDVGDQIEDVEDDVGDQIEDDKDGGDMDKKRDEDRGVEEQQMLRLLDICTCAADIADDVAFGSDTDECIVSAHKYRWTCDSCVYCTFFYLFIKNTIAFFRLLLFFSFALEKRPFHKHDSTKTAEKSLEHVIRPSNHTFDCRDISKRHECHSI